MTYCKLTILACFALVAISGCAGVDAPFAVSQGSGSVGVDVEAPITPDGFDPSFVLAVHTDDFGDDATGRFNRFLDEQPAEQTIQRFEDESGIDLTRRRLSAWPRTTYESTSDRRRVSTVDVPVSTDAAVPLLDHGVSEQPQDASAIDAIVETSGADVDESIATLGDLSTATEKLSAAVPEVAEVAVTPATVRSDPGVTENRVDRFDDLFPASVSRIVEYDDPQSVAPESRTDDSRSERRGSENAGGDRVRFVSPDGNEFVIETVVRWRKAQSSQLLDHFLDARAATPGTQVRPASYVEVAPVSQRSVRRPTLLKRAAFVESLPQ